MALTAVINFCLRFIYIYIYIYIYICVCVCVRARARASAEIHFTTANISFNGSVFSSCVFETCCRREKR